MHWQTCEGEGLPGCCCFIVYYEYGGLNRDRHWMPSACCSLRGDAELHICLLLLLGESTEEINLLLAGGLPRVVRLEGALEVRLDVHIERLRLYL